MGAKPLLLYGDNIVPYFYRKLGWGEGTPRNPNLIDTYQLEWTHLSD
jgi:hypothetical protein